MKRKTRDIVRVLNEYGGTGNGEGFYASYATWSIRCNRARRRKGVLEVHSFAVEGGWVEPSQQHFTDVYGREITA